MSHPPEPLAPIPWSVVAKTGESMRVPPPQNRFTSDGSTTSLSFVSTYEDENLSNKLIADKASRILQEALHPSAVLFTFLQSDFAKQSDLFKLISDKIGPIDGVQIITKPGRTNLKHEIYVQVNFVRLSDSEKAVTEGLTFKNRQYKAVPTSDGAPIQLTRVRIGRIPFSTPANTVDVEVQRRLNQEALCHKLKSSLEPYGRVCQIQKVMADGYFQGEISVLLDCNVPTAKEDEEHRQPLARMLYLRDFNKYCPASYKGALPVCYLCRQAGHVKTCCPKIASILCYHCRGCGHIARFCPDKGKDRMSNEEKLNSYIEENKSTKTPRVALREDSPRISSMDSVISDSLDSTLAKCMTPAHQPEDTDPIVVCKNPDEIEISDGDSLEDKEVSIMEVDRSSMSQEENVLTQASFNKTTPALIYDPEGSAASVHAPRSIRSTMDVDRTEKKNEHRSDHQMRNTRTKNPLRIRLIVRDDETQGSSPNGSSNPNHHL